MTPTCCYPHGMRAILVSLVVLAGCPSTTGGECQRDVDCGDDVCARDMMCAPAASVRQVTVTWTVGGAAASATTCAAMPNLALTFIGRDPTDTLGFAPVPCELGRFLIDKLPDRFGQVELGVEGGSRAERRSISSSNTVSIDL